jgi:hypothetical protein
MKLTVVTLRILLALANLALVAGCEEIGPEAKGEINTTALQAVGTDRECIPLFDMVQARARAQGRLEVVLRDGTRWSNDLHGSCVALIEDATVAFSTDTDAACEADKVQVLDRAPAVWRHVSTCTLGRFELQ